MLDNEAEVKKLVNSMTNWQRNQWAKAGYPGSARGPNNRLGKRDANPKDVLPFTTMVKHRPLKRRLRAS